MRCIRLPNGNLLIPVKLDDSAEGFGMREVGPDDPEYLRLLVWAEDGEDPRAARGDANHG
jgi:hypothetical protein